ncbi:longitudinals lacking protein, isoforms N/O/W/X/Y isoform X1 [Bombus terrestris]|uniref:Longitudinals lacking protein, isoforms N/O/W/X/Y isoform X1 n=1 Tax=Bombus terrestris TaxID=30195 RepID=A0A6P3TSV2_BOMTE|nr:longitudinals lacking protein, isoforms N/O/W/X/Y isoform X1 [Bombus terrestris]XP_012166853.1 longitudinals lacking protein, isoforms N/O/W/X/Y isoform X1 [Bombus terrestris]
MEDDQQFCLRWNNHQSTLIQNFDTLLESGTLVDCTLAAEGKYLKAHKVVLSACSPYFEGLLSEHYDKHPVFILKDVKFKELKAMMDYMYRGEVNISQDQLAALLKAAESLQIKGLSESKTSGSSKTDSRQQKVVPQTSQPDIPISSSGLTIEKNKVPRQGVSQGPLGDLPEDSASPQIPKGLSSREGSQSPTSRKRKRFRRKSIGDDNSVENHEASNSSDMPQQMGVPALGIAPVADEKSHADPTDSIGRSALMTQLTKPADEMLQLPLEKPEPSDNLIEPKSEYLEDPEESVEDLTLDDDMNDLNEMEQDNNRAGPSHDPSQHPAGIGAWHVTGDRSNAGGVVGSVAGAPGTTDEVFLAAQEAAQAHRDSQDYAKMRFYVSRLPKDRRRSRGQGRFACDNCDRRYHQMKNLRRHVINECVESQYPAISVFKHTCATCGKTYKHKHHLKRHHDFECGIDPKFKCAFCPHRTRYKDSLMKHILARHQHFLDQNPRYRLQQVDALADVEDTQKYSSSNWTVLALPTLTPVNTALYTRHLRSMTFKGDQDKMRRYGPRKYLCTDCNRKFALMASLKRHRTFECNKRTAMSEKNVREKLNEQERRRKKKHSCSNCNRSYKLFTSLWRHQNYECGVEPKFSCPICKSRFSQKANLERHVRTKH